MIDVDGTVALAENQEYYRTPPAVSLASIPNMRLINFINLLPFKKIFVSGRLESQREETEAFLNKYFTGFELVLKSHNSQSDLEYKVSVYHLLHEYSDIIAVFEDRMKIIRWLKDEGANVLNCGNSEEF